MITVKFSKAMAGKLEEFVFDEGATVADLLDAANYSLDPSREQVTCKGEGKVDEDTELKDGGIYIIATSVKGGRI